MWQKRLLKAVSCVLAGVLVLASSGCAGSSGTDKKGSVSAPARLTVPSGTTPGWKGDTSPVTITWFVNLSYWKWNGTYGSDLLSKTIEKKTGVKFKFVTPATDDNQELSTMIAANNLPDIITLDAASTLKDQIARGGYVYSINDLINQYDRTFWNIMHNDVFNWFEEDDGKTYGLPNYAYSKDDVSSTEKLEPNGCILVRQDMYDAIGRPNMTTPQGFLDACQKVKNTVGTYNGKSIIPIQLYEFSSTGNNSLLWLSQYFATPYEDKNGKYLYNVLQPQYKEATSFLNKAYRRGLINDANFSDTRDMINERVASGTVFALFSAPQDFAGSIESLYEKDPKARYVAMELRNSEGDAPVLQDIRGYGWLFNMITKKAKNPDRIIKLFEYLYSKEGQMDVHFGQEGLTYNWNSSHTKVEWTKQYQQDYDNGTSGKYGLDAMNLLSNYAEVMNLEPEPTKAVDSYIKHMKDPMKQYSYDYSASFLRPDPADSRTNAISNERSQIEYYWGSQLPKIITAGSDTAFGTLYGQTVQGMKSKGLDDLISYDNDAFQNAKKTLGITRSWPPLLTGGSASLSSGSAASDTKK